MGGEGVGDEGGGLGGGERGRLTAESGYFYRP